MKRGQSPLRPLLLLGGAVLVTHAPLLLAGYVQDDHLVVESDRASSALTESYWEGVRGGDRSLYRPVTLLTYAAERAAAGGAKPALSHAINVALHAAAAMTLFALARSLGIEPSAALWGALFFAVTPSKSEAVANVVGRAEVLAALFTLASLRLTVAATRAAAWGAGACVLLACASKETGFVALPLVALTALLVGNDAKIRAGLLLPSLLGVTIVTIARTLALEAFFPPQTVPFMDNPLAALSGVERLAAALAVAAVAARIVLFPWGLANDYSGPSIPIETSLLAVRPLLGGAVLIALGAVAVWGAWTGRKAAAIGATTALLAYLVTGNLLRPVGAIFAERFLYLPVAGLSLIAAAALAGAGRTVRLCAAGICLVSGLLMIGRARDWRDDATIFAATARHNPESPRAHLWLGVLAAERGNAAAAEASLRRAAALAPSLPAPHLHLGLLEVKRGDLRAAVASFEAAARIDPSWGASQLNLALARHRLGERVAAERAARRAVLLDPDNPRAWAELGHLRYERGSCTEAVVAYRRAIALGRRDLAPRLAECELTTRREE